MNSPDIDYSDIDSSIEDIPENDILNYISSLTSVEQDHSQSEAEIESTVRSVIDSVSIENIFSDSFKNYLPERTEDNEYIIKPSIPFCTFEKIRLITIHSDLQNEPYTKIDTGIRPDIYTTRPFFHFSISEPNVECRVGLCSYSFKKVGRRIANPPEKRGWKIESFISVVDVYDEYGLDMVYSYLHYLYYSELSILHPNWIASYVIGSLAILRPDYSLTLHQHLLSGSITGNNPLPTILLASSVLLTEFILMDENRMKKTVPDSCSIVLPMEILARIINSKRISKELSVHVTSLRKNRELRIGELECRAKYGIVYESRARNIYLMTGEGRWKLVKGSNPVHPSESNIHYYLTYNMGGCAPSGTVTLYSPRDYASIRRVSEKDMYSKMLREVDTQDERQLCIWIVHLSYTLDVRDEEIRFKRDDLLPYFRDLSAKILSREE